MITIEPVPAPRQVEVLSLLFHQHPADVRDSLVADVLLAVRRGESTLDGLWVATRKGEPVGAALAVVQADGTAFAWPPVALGTDDDNAVHAALFAAIERYVRAAGAHTCQCLIDIDRTDEQALLLRHRYWHAADLDFLVRSLLAPLDPLPPSRFVTVPFEEGPAATRFAAILERTYVDTQDCPALNGLRTGAQALDSYRTTGTFDPSRWRIFRERDEDVGVLLLSAHSDQHAWEVVYMGVVPEARGRGISHAMLLEGLHLARDAGAQAVFLAVDCRNAVARRIYDALGFRAHVRRRVLLRWPERPSP